MGIKKFLIIVLLSFFVCNKSEEKYIYLVKPEDIIGIATLQFFCNDRTWQFSENFKLKNNNNILYLNFVGSSNDTESVFTTSEKFEKEDKEKEIVFKGKKFIVFQLEKEIQEKIFIHSAILTNEYIDYKQTIDMKNKSKILIKLPDKGEKINHFRFYFTGEKGIIGIKSIYMK